MLFNAVINLISNSSNTTNNIGDPIPTPTSREVFADKQSIRQSEFYQAAATGLRPEIMFVIRTIDYNQESQLQYNNKTYEIIRTYDKGGEFIELVCQGIVNKGA